MGRNEAMKEFPKIREGKMESIFVSIGFGNIISVSRFIAVINPESAPIRRIIREAKEKGMLINATCGRRAQAVMIADSGHIVLSPVQPETVAHRVNENELVRKSKRQNKEEKGEGGNVK